MARWCCCDHRFQVLDAYGHTGQQPRIDTPRYRRLYGGSLTQCSFTSNRG